jgi:diacylglycerol kinase family enzyme
MNLLAKDLRIPLDPKLAVEALAAGTVREIDAGWVNGRIFLCNSMLGMASRLAKRRERMRGGGTGRLRDMMAMATAALRWYSRYPPLTVRIDSGNGPERLRTRVIAVVNNDYDEGFGQMLTRSTLDGGKLVLYFARDLTVWKTVRVAASMFIGRWREHPELERHELNRLVIHSARKTLRVMNDGEVMLMHPPLRYRIRPGALRVIVPTENAATVAPATPALGQEAAA